MEILKLYDGTTIPLEEGASLAEMRHIAANETAALAVCNAITPENLRHVEFSMDGNEPHGIYDNLIADHAPTRQTLEGGGVLVVISLREKTAVELRLDALEESQETQDGAIADIGQALSDIVEA